MVEDSIAVPKIGRTSGRAGALAQRECGRDVPLVHRSLGCHRGDTPARVGRGDSR